MKTLTIIILLALTFQVSGQGHIDSTTRTRLEYHIMLQIPITIGLLFEYETECYNDSTEIIIKNHLFVTDGADTVGYYNTSFPTGIYEHKQPTFPDFIKWLHKKTEQ